MYSVLVKSYVYWQRKSIGFTTLAALNLQVFHIGAASACFNADVYLQTLDTAKRHGQLFTV